MRIVHVLIQHPCPLSAPVTASARGLRVTHLCHRGKETTLEAHSPDPVDLAPLLETYRNAGGIELFREGDGSAALVRFATCACCRSGRVIPTIEAAGNLYLPPSIYSVEGETYQFLVPEDGLDNEVLATLPADVRVLRIGTRALTSLGFEDTFLVPVGNLLSNLTPRQRQAIVLAFARGYYRIPHAVTTGELAQALEISREAFDALLRKAENKLLAALFPYLAAQSASRESPISSARSAGAADS